MKPYRKNAGIVVFNSSGEILVGERINWRGVFQFPQGGIDEGEDPLEAARRELYEECGLKLEEPAGEVEEWLSYEFPENVPDHLKKYRGQSQKWFFFHWDGDPDTLELDLHEREFSRMLWSRWEEIVPQIVEFKRPVYRQLQKSGEKIIQDYLNRQV